jgi:hypothetical protein
MTPASAGSPWDGARKPHDLEQVYQSFISEQGVTNILALLQPDKTDIMATKSTKKHGRINALIAIFPCPSVDFVAIK